MMGFLDVMPFVIRFFFRPIMANESGNEPKEGNPVEAEEQEEIDEVYFYSLS